MFSQRRRSLSSKVIGMKVGAIWLAGWESIPEREEQGKCSKGLVSVCLRTRKEACVGEQGERC